MKDIPKFILTELEAIENVEAILLTGSQAIGKNTKNSDWDFMIILKEGFPRWRKTWKVQGEWIELMCNDRKQIEREFEEDLIEGRGVTTMMFATGHIIFDNKNNTLKSLISKAEKNWIQGPVKLSEEKLGVIDYDISTYIQDIEDCLYEDNNAILLIDYAVNEFVNYYYRLGDLWAVRPKDRMANIQLIAPDLHKLIVQKEGANHWREKAETAILIGELVGKKYSLNLNGEVMVSPEK